MKRSIGSMAALTAVALVSSVSFVKPAEASCSDAAPAASPAPLSSYSGYGLQQTVFYPGAGRLVRIADDGQDGEWTPPQAVIVGMWRFSFISEGSKGIPNGTEVDAGYATWHSDGTELMNSGREPKTGDFCMGVWKKEKDSTFMLNHFALAFDPTGTTLVGPANIRETVTVAADRDSYSGTFTLDQYATDGHTLLAHVQGKVKGQRITVDCKETCGY